MFKLFIIGCGGFIGAVARYGLSGWVHRNNMSDFFQDQLQNVFQIERR